METSWCSSVLAADGSQKCKVPLFFVFCVYGMRRVGATMALTRGSQPMLNPKTPNVDVWVGNAAVQQCEEEFTGWNHAKCITFVQLSDPRLRALLVDTPGRAMETMLA